MTTTTEGTVGELENIRKHLEENLKKCQSSRELSKMDADAKSMITHYIHMTDEVERRRQQLLTFSLATLTAWIAAIGLLVSQSANINRLVFWPIMSILGSQVVFSFIVALLHEIQSGFRYPFLGEEKYGNQWKWFYYANPFVKELSVSAKGSRRGEQKEFLSYLKGLDLFAEQYAQETEESRTRQNIIQLYLLQVHNYYKNQFYLQLTKIRNRSFFAIGPVFVVTLVVCLLLGEDNNAGQAPLPAKAAASIDSVSRPASVDTLGPPVPGGGVNGASSSPEKNKVK